MPLGTTLPIRNQNVPFIYRAGLESIVEHDGPRALNYAARFTRTVGKVQETTGDTLPYIKKIASTSNLSNISPIGKTVVGY